MFSLNNKTRRHGRLIVKDVHRIGELIFFVLLCLSLSLILYFALTEENLKVNMIEDESKEIFQEYYNSSIYLQKDLRGNISISISGTGVLTRDDLNKLYEKEGINIDDIRIISISSGITEIGYNVFSDYPHLSKLYIHGGVKVIRNGAIRRCPELVYIYIPSSVEKISQDFMNGCINCYIDSPRKISDLIMKSKPTGCIVVQHILDNDRICLLSDNWNGNEFIMYGVSGAEPWGTWTDGNVLLFAFNAEESDYVRVTLNVSEVFNKEQTAIVYLNSCKIAEFFVTEPQSYDFMFQRPEDGYCEIKIEWPNCISPFELEGTGDMRKLGVRLNTIDISCFMDE